MSPSQSYPSHLHRGLDNRLGAAIGSAQEIRGSMTGRVVDNIGLKLIF